ncbi:hypothetical protein [Paenibacillus glycinis]|uniref:Uncharacterized protein n=1 Tax=Paenibacillus glycinis TaxID=2697035 RepID=A0ABW9XSF8_9BACL|nr:hypothetical protein [Paenibacillus glycinis]NBD25413.1 hypothetical protein [Paenibacillus glycinis]
MTWINVLVSFIGGGAVGAILNWIRADLADKRLRRIKYLEDQLINLYGPLNFIISQSSKLFEIESKFQRAYKDEYIDKTYSEEKLTQERLEEDVKKTIKIRNEYIIQVSENNLKIKELLDKSFSYLDGEDIDLVMNYFYENFIRLQTEERGKVPFIIHKHVGDISFLRPEFIEGIRMKFIKKKQEVEKLSVEKWGRSTR